MIVIIDIGSITYGPFRARLPYIYNIEPYRINNDNSSMCTVQCMQCRSENEATSACVCFDRHRSRPRTLWLWWARSSSPAIKSYATAVHRMHRKQSTCVCVLWLRFANDVIGSIREHNHKAPLRQTNVYLHIFINIIIIISIVQS